LRPLNPARDSLVKRPLPRAVFECQVCLWSKANMTAGAATPAFGSTSDRSDSVWRQPLGWASPQPSAGSGRQRRRPTFSRRHAAWQAPSPRPAEPAFEDHGGQQSAWLFHQRFEAKPEHDENYSYPPLTQTTRSSAQCEHMHYATGFSNAGRILFDKRRMQQADARKTARPTTDEAKRHASAIHLQAICGPCELNPSRCSIWRIAMGSAPFLRPLVAPGECPFSGAGESGQGQDATRLPVMTPTRALPLRHPGHSHLIGGLAPKEVVRIATHQCASEIVVLTAPATLFKTEKSSRSAGPQKRTKAPRCKLTRGARGCEPAPRTPLPLSHGTELSLAWPCPVGAAGCTHKSWSRWGICAPQ
jgi:hypothetical protein